MACLVKLPKSPFSGKFDYSTANGAYSIASNCPNFRIRCYSRYSEELRMKASRICLGFAAVLAIVGLFAVPAAAHADTYEIFDLAGSAGPGSLDAVGITASGTAVLVYNLPAGAPQCLISGICHEYETFVDGVMVNESPTAPNLVYDNGTPCTVSAPFLTDHVPGTCNNGHEVYTAGSAIAPYSNETFTGPDPVADLFVPPLGEPDIDFVHLNSSGDFVYDAYHNGDNGAVDYHEAIDLTSETPEPASIFLLGTGLIAVAGTLRRRLIAGSH